MTFLNDLGTGLALQSTDRPAALAHLLGMWAGLAADDKAGRCILAHYIADLQDDVESELEWDEKALAAADGVTDADLQKLHPTLTVAGFIPSLQLNVADCYRRVGRFADAQRALALSMASNESLPAALPEQVAYREMILGGQQNLAAKIAGQDRSA